MLSFGKCVCFKPSDPTIILERIHYEGRRSLGWLFFHVFFFFWVGERFALALGISIWTEKSYKIINLLLKLFQSVPRTCRLPKLNLG